MKTLNAKKIDINFDNDDFFNSFQPATTTQIVQPVKTFSKTKLQEVDDPFEIAPSVVKSK